MSAAARRKGRSSLAVQKNPCAIGWAGCDSYTGGHSCRRGEGHGGRHKCDCGATRVPDIKTTTERFWEKVDTSGDCWEWRACTNTETGYGRFGFNGRTWGAHQASYIFAHGEIPEGKFVLHRCDNRRCVRPDHLYAGTAKDNMRDALERGRQVARRGEAAANARLTDEQVREIRRRYDAGESQPSIAEDFDITAQYVGQLGARLWRKTA